MPFKGEGWQMRSCSSSVLVQQTAEQVRPVYLAWITRWCGCLRSAAWSWTRAGCPEAVQVQAWQTGLIPYVPAHAGGDDPAESLAARL